MLTQPQVTVRAHPEDREADGRGPAGGAVIDVTLVAGCDGISEFAWGIDVLPAGLGVATDKQRAALGAAAGELEVESALVAGVQVAVQDGEDDVVPDRAGRMAPSGVPSGTSE